LVAHLAAVKLAKATGGPVTIGSASGGWLHDAQVADLQLSGPGSVPAWHLSLDRLAASYHLALLKGDLRALRQIGLSGLHADVTISTEPTNAKAVVWPAVLARLPSTLPGLQIDGRVTVRSGASETRISGIRIHYADDLLTVSAARIEVAGRTLVLPEIVVRRTAPDTVRLDKPVTLTIPGLPSQVFCDQLELTLGETVQQVIANGRLAGGRWHVRASAGGTRLELQGVDLAEIAALPAVAGKLPVDAVLEEAAGGWELRSLQVTGGGVSIQATASVQADPWRCSSLTADITVDLARVRQLLPDAPPLRGQLQAHVQGALPLYPQDWIHGDVTVAVSGTDVVIAGAACKPLQLNLRCASGDLTIEACEVAWNDIRLVLGEALPTPARSPADVLRLLPRPISMSGGTVSVAATCSSSGDLVGEAQLSGLQLQGLPSLSAMRHLRGVVSGQMHLAGTVSKPAWDGQLAVDGLEVKISSDVPTLTAGQARVSILPGLLRLDQLYGELGGAPLSITGQVQLAGEPQFDLRCQGHNLLLIQRPDVRVRADLDLQLGGTPAHPLLAGTVLVRSALITPELHLTGTTAGPGDGRLLLFEMPDLPLSQVRFDLQLKSMPVHKGDPTSGVRVVNRWGRGNCDVDLHLGGTGAAPEPQGRVSVRDGLVTLPFSTLKVGHGELLFPAGEPFQPRVAVNASAKVRQYDVQLLVSGPLSDPVVRVTGTGLDEQDAYMLLTTGSLPRDQSQQAAIGMVGTWLGQEAWRKFEGDPDPDAGPSVTDRLTIAWGRETSALGNDTIDSEFELTTPGTRPNVLLYGQRDRYDEYNAGILLRLYWGGEEP